MLDPRDLLAENGGIIEPSFQFAGESEADLLSRLEKYLDTGYTYDVIGGTEDDAARAYAYYRALEAQVTRMASVASTIGVIGEGYRSYTGEQIRTLQGLADYWKAQFDSYFPADDTAATLDTWPVHYSARR